MKKVGIITWHYLDNYGSILQAYALSSLISTMGYQVKIINYCKGSKNNLLFYFLRNLKYSFLIGKNTTNKRKSKFYKFRKKYFDETKLFSNNQELCNYRFNYDYYICGSDQIWAANRFDPSYYLNFVNGKKIAYAPSAVVNTYTDECEKEINSLLSSFKHVSLREDIGAKIIKNITGNDYPVVLDPTLLFDQKDYSKIKSSKFNFSNYIFCYFIGDDDKYRESVERLAGLLQKKIISLVITKNHNFGDFILKGIGPEEFLELISKADIVLTDSYHGTLLSIVYEKNFWAYKRFKNDDKSSQNSRLENILNKLNVIDRLIDENYNWQNQSTIDYNVLNRFLKEEQKKSLNYLFNALECKND